MNECKIWAVFNLTPYPHTRDCLFTSSLTINHKHFGSHIVILLANECPAKYFNENILMDFNFVFVMTVSAPRSQGENQVKLLHAQPTI